MRYIKLFEKYDLEDINDRLLSLLDIGFKVTKTLNYYSDEKAVQKDLYLAKKEVTVITLEKEIPEVLVDLTPGPEYIKWDRRSIDIFEQISYFCGFFDNCYYNIEFSDYKFILAIRIIEDVDSDKKNKAVVEKVNVLIEEYFISYRNYIFDNITKKFKEESDRNKLGETIVGGRIYRMHGNLESELLIFPFNTTKLNNRITKDNLNIIESYTNRFFSHNPFIKAKLKKIELSDIKILEEVYKNKVSNYFTERYEGLNAIFIYFDYNKLLKDFIERNKLSH